jgi:hypothetical protein
VRAGTGTWYEIVRSPQIVAFLDTARVERLGTGHARIWFRFVYGTPTTIGTDTTRYRAMEAREEVDCPQRRTRDLEMRMESMGGIFVGSLTPEAPWQSIDTHALNSGVFLVACRSIGHQIPPRAGS